MPTVFIALLCYQCSTMQVKQQKKSSNKWTCVVCNERQSVTKIYARSGMAKDVRSFVQTFNMSRLSKDLHHPISDPIQTLDLQDHHISATPHKKRTDWTQYIHLQDQNLIDFDYQNGNEFEPKIVTEPMFKRPQLKRNTIRKRTSHGEFMEIESNEFQKMMPQGSDELADCTMVPGKEFAKSQQSVGRFQRKGYEDRDRDDHYESSEMTIQQKMTDNVLPFGCNGVKDDHGSGSGDFLEKQHAKSRFAAIALKWKGNGVQKEKESVSVEAKRYEKKKARIGSKWNDYISEDDDDFGGCSRNLQGGSCRDQLDWKSDMYDMNLGSQKVEEDIHPDFL